MTTTSSTPTASPIAQIEALYARLSKARTLVANGKVHPVVNMPSHYAVEGNAGFYIVNGSCCCNDAANRNELIKGHCKHRLAAFLYAEQHGQAGTYNPKATLKAQVDYWSLPGLENGVQLGFGKLKCLANLVVYPQF